MGEWSVWARVRVQVRVRVSVHTRKCASVKLSMFDCECSSVRVRAHTAVRLGIVASLSCGNCCCCRHRCRDLRCGHHDGGDMASWQSWSWHLVMAVVVVAYSRGCRCCRCVTAIAMVATGDHSRCDDVARPSAPSSLSLHRFVVAVIVINVAIRALV